MATMTNILVKDDATTPKEWTFIPVTDSPFPQWRTNDPTLPIIAQLRFSQSIDKTKTGMKITQKLEVPVLETLGASGTALGYVAAPKVAHVLTYINTCFCDDRSTSSDRANGFKINLGISQGANSTTGQGTFVNTAAGDGFKTSNRDLIQTFISAVLPS